MAGLACDLQRCVLVLRCAGCALGVCAVCRCPALESLSLAQCGNLFDFHDDAWQVSTYYCFVLPHSISAELHGPVATQSACAAFVGVLLRGRA